MQRTSNAGFSPTASWSIGGAFLEALACRDFAVMTGLLAADARLRALLPSGTIERTGAADIVERFAYWFGDASGFETIDGAVGAVGDRLHLRWRLRVDPTPRGDDGWHVIEQQAYVTAHDRITAIDLLCSGFHRETVEFANALSSTENQR